MMTTTTKTVSTNRIGIKKSTLLFAIASLLSAFSMHAQPGDYYIQLTNLTTAQFCVIDDEGPEHVGDCTGINACVGDVIQIDYFNDYSSGGGNVQVSDSIFVSGAASGFVGNTAGPGGTPLTYVVTSAGVYSFISHYTSGLWPMTVKVGSSSTTPQYATNPASPVCQGQSVCLYSLNNPNDIISYQFNASGTGPCTTCGCGSNSPGSYNFSVGSNPVTYIINPGMSCSVTTTFSVDVLPIQTSLTYTQAPCASPDFTLQATLNCNYSSYAGISYNWSINGPSGYTNTYSSSSANTWSFTVPSAGSYTVSNTPVVQGVGGATSTVAILYSPSSTLCCQSANLSISGNVSPQIASPYTTTLMEVPTGATLYINSNFTFNGVQIRMMPNSSIVVNPGVTLTLNNCHLFGCTYMWEGITLLDGSQLVATAGTTIDDANIAILSNGVNTPPVISLTSTYLNKNYYGIDIENYPTVASYPITLTSCNINGNVASMYSPGTSLKPYKRLWIPDVFYPVTTEFGIFASSVAHITIGAAGSLSSFTKMHTGVRSMNSNVNVNACQFLNMNPPTITDGKGIWASSTCGGHIFQGSGYEFMLNVGVGGTSNKCVFNNLPYGIYTDNCMSSNIQNNNIFEVSTDAVYITGCNYYRNNGAINNTSNVQNNYIRPLNSVMQNGVVYDGNLHLVATVLSNTITTQASTGTSEGVRIAHTATNTTTAYTVNSNTITGNFNNGISCNYVNSAQINSNIINTQEAYACGVYLYYGSLNAVKQNTIDASSQPNNRNAIKGISLYASTVSTLWCNVIKQIEFGVNSFLDCSVADVDGNTFNGCYKAINITWGSIGQQGSPTSGVMNWFTNSYGTPGNKLCDVFTDNCAGQSYYATKCSSLSDCPTVGTNGGSTETVYCTAPARTGRVVPTCLTCSASRMAGTGRTQPESPAVLYPNPANNRIYVKEEGAGAVSLTIFNLLGEQVVPETMAGEQGVDVSKLENGMYICLVRSADGTTAKKQIVISK